MTLSVSPSLADDVPSWQRLAREVEREFGAPMADDAVWQRALLRHMNDGTALCATDRLGRLLGGAWVSRHSHFVQIDWLAVLPEERRSGVGLALVDAVIAMAGEQSVRVVTFGDEHPMQQEAIAARNLYLAAGFAPTEESTPDGPDGTPRATLQR